MGERQEDRDRGRKTGREAERRAVRQEDREGGRKTGREAGSPA